MMDSRKNKEEAMFEYPAGRGKTKSPSDQKRIDSARDRYLAAAHAMQSGVAYDPDKSSQEPKHLRVGINSGKVEHEGLVTLLASKGIITEVEYYEAMAEAMEREWLRYTVYLREKLGDPRINLA